MKKISILIPIHNAEPYLPLFLKSLYSNTIIKDCEVFFYNDCSTDNSIITLESFINKNNQIKEITTIINSNEKRTIGYVRNQLLKKINSEYFIFVDCDDYVENTYLEKLYICAKQTDSDIVECNYYEEFTNRTIFSTCGKPMSGKDAVLGKLYGTKCAYLWIKLIKSSLVQKNNITFIDSMTLCEDELFTYQVYYYANKVETISDYLYHYSHHKNSITQQLFSDSKIKDICLCIETAEKFLLSKFQEDIVKPALDYRKMNRKIFIIFNTYYSLQKKYRNLWADSNYILNQMNYNFIYKIILRGKNSFIYNIGLPVIMFLKRFKFKNYTLSEYFNKN